MSTERRDEIAKALFLSEHDASDPEVGERIWHNICRKMPETEWHRQADRFQTLYPIDREARAQAWDEGREYEAQQAIEGWNGDASANPYREVTHD